MKRKYTGPYGYKGYREHYLTNQMEVKRLYSRWDEITVREFVFGAKEQPKPYNVKLRNATVKEVMYSFSDIFCHELIERLPLADVLSVKGRNIADYKEIAEATKKALEEKNAKDALIWFEKCSFGNEKKEKEYLQQYDIPAIPVTDLLYYRYDYGDGWEERSAQNRHCDIITEKYKYL